MTKLVFTFRNFSNVPKNIKCLGEKICNIKSYLETLDIIFTQMLKIDKDLFLYVLLWLYLFQLP